MRLKRNRKENPTKLCNQTKPQHKHDSSQRIRGPDVIILKTVMGAVVVIAEVGEGGGGEVEEGGRNWVKASLWLIKLIVSDFDQYNIGMTPILR